jgi:hypothetical protein
MKLFSLLLAFGLVLASSSSVEAASRKKTAPHHKTKKVLHRTQGHLQTDVSFDDSVLHGQYQAPEETMARVENEKGLEDLLGVRKHFKDRLPEAAEQE